MKEFLLDISRPQVPKPGALIHFWGSLESGQRVTRNGRIACETSPLLCSNRNRGFGNQCSLRDAFRRLSAYFFRKLSSNASSFQKTWKLTKNVKATLRMAEGHAVWGSSVACFLRRVPAAVLGARHEENIKRARDKVLASSIFSSAWEKRSVLPVASNRNRLSNFGTKEHTGSCRSTGKSRSFPGPQFLYLKCGDFLLQLPHKVAPRIQREERLCKWCLIGWVY